MTPAVHPTFSPRLIATRDEAPGVRAFRFASPAGFAFTPGQFVMLHFADDPKTWRAYSLCSAPADAAAHFEVTVAMVGDFSARLGRLSAGVANGLVARGPFGRWTYDGSPAHAVLVSGGTGITPFRAMCLHKARGGKAGRLTVLYSARTPEALVFRREFATWEAAGVEVRARVTRPAEGSEPWLGPIGRWTADEVLKAAADPAADYFICGPNKMVAELREGLTARGVAPARVHTEKWGDYADLI